MHVHQAMQEQLRFSREPADQQARKTIIGLIKSITNIVFLAMNANMDYGEQNLLGSQGKGEQVFTSF